MEQFLNQIEVLNYKIDNSDDNFAIGTIPMSMYGAPSDYLVCNIAGFEGTSNYCNMYIGCGELFTGSLDVSLVNYPVTGYIDVSMFSTTNESLFSSVDLFITTESDTVFDNAGELYVSVAAPSSADITSSLDISLSNSENYPASSLDVFLMNEHAAMTAALKLQIAGDGLYDGYIPHGEGLMCHLERWPGEMLIVSMPVMDALTDNNIDLSMVATILYDDALDISLPNNSTELSGSVESYISGF